MPRTGSAMAKAAPSLFACSDCGYSSRALVRQAARAAASSGRSSRRPRRRGRRRAAAAAAAPAARRRRGRGGRADPHRRPRARPRARRRARPASLVLVGGEPGVGKSTLLLMALRAIEQERRALLVTGEESPAQVKLRAATGSAAAAAVEVLAETELETVCATLERERPDVCVIDSVQTLYAAELGSAPGSVAQVREAAARLLRVAKENGVAIFLVGHVTKDGAVAGPRVLEHLVDCVLQFEGDRYRAHRDPARGEEPLRLDERARRLRDDRRRARRRPRPVRALRPQRGRARSAPPSPARSRARGRSCSRSRRSSRRPTSRCRGASRPASTRSGWR